MAIRDTTGPRSGNAREGEELEAFARSLGAEIYGVATADAFNEFPDKPQPSKFVKILVPQGASFFCLPTCNLD